MTARVQVHASGAYQRAQADAARRRRWLWGLVWLSLGLHLVELGLLAGLWR